MRNLLIVAFFAFLTCRVLSEEIIIDPFLADESIPANISSLSLSDPMLASIYAIALSEPGVPVVRGMEPSSVVGWRNEAYRDLQRRGDTASGLLLAIMKGYPNTRYESRIFSAASTIETISLIPFLEYWRNVVRSRTEELSSEMTIVAETFARHGTSGDIDLMKWLTSVRPDLEADIHRTLDTQRRALVKQGKTVPKALLDWKLDRNIDAVVGSVEEFEKLTNEELKDLVGQHETKIADRMGAADPLPPPPTVETPDAQKASETSNPRPPAELEETPSPPSGGGSGFAIGLVAGALALLAGVWFWLRRKSS